MERKATRHDISRFKDLIDRYVTEIIPKKLGEQQERNRVNVFYRSELLNIPLFEIKPQDFATYRDVRLKSVKSSTVNRELAILSIICELAMREWGLLHENPIRKISKPKNPKERTCRPTQQEINDICTALIYNLNEPPELVYQRVACCLFVCNRNCHARRWNCRANME